MINKEIIIDVDGVLADFEEKFVRTFGNTGRWKVKLEDRYPEHIDEIEWFVENPATYADLDVIPLGVKVLRLCYQSGYDIHIVSSRPAQAEQITGQWLNQNKIPFHFLSVGIKHKAQYIIQQNPIMVVEDMFDTAKQVGFRGIPVFLINQPWNQGRATGVHRIMEFRQFEPKFQEICNFLALLEKI